MNAKLVNEACFEDIYRRIQNSINKYTESVSPDEKTDYQPVVDTLTKIRKKIRSAQEIFKSDVLDRLKKMNIDIQITEAPVLRVETTANMVGKLIDEINVILINFGEPYLNIKLGEIKHILNNASNELEEANSRLKKISGE